MSDFDLRKEPRKPKARRVPKGVLRKQQPKWKAKFDATLGYPGEGPTGVGAPRGRPTGRGTPPGRGRAKGVRGQPRRRDKPPSRACFNCGQVGHLQGDCPVSRLRNRMRGALAGAAPVADVLISADEGEAKVQHEEMVGNDGVGVAAGPNLVNDHPNMGGLSDSSGSDSDEEEGKRSSADIKIDEAEALRVKMYVKACSMFIRIDVASQADRMTVRRTLANMSSIGNGAHLFGRGAGAEADLIFRNAMRDTLHVRDESALSVMCSNTQKPMWQCFVEGWNLARRRTERTICKRITAHEAVEPLSLDKESKWGRLLRVGATFVRIVADASFEEYSKRFAVTSFMRALREFSNIGAQPTRSYAYLLLARFRAQPIKIQFVLLRATIAAMLSATESKSIIMYVAKLLVHCVLTSIPIAYAVPLHSAWNLFSHYYGDPSHMLRSKLLVTGESKPYVKLDTCLALKLVKPVDVQGEFKVKRISTACIPCFAMRRGFSVKGFEPIINRQCACNEAIAMDGRVGKLLPKHASQDILRTTEQRWCKLRAVADVLASMVRPVYCPMNYDEWCGTFPARKRNIFLDMRHNIFEPIPKPKDIKASSFNKKEKVVVELAVQDELVFSDPRFIQGCPPKLSAYVGPHIRRLAKNVHMGLKPRGMAPSDVSAGKQIIYTCGMSNEEIGGSFSKAITAIESMCGANERVIFVEDDQSRFDLHLGKGAFGVLNHFYRKTLTRKIRVALRRTNKSTGMTGLGTKYSVPYTMQSGWPDTSCGDTVINACLKHYVHKTGRKWISIICGDDSVTITTDVEYARIGGDSGAVALYTELGLEVKLQSTYDPMAVEFCSARFMPCGLTHVLIPKSGKLLARLGWDVSKRTDTNFIAWLRGIQITLSTLGKYCPLLRALADNIHARIGSGKVIEENKEYKLFADGSASPTEGDVLYYLYYHYSLSARDVGGLVEYLRHSNIDEPLAFSALEAIVRHDC